MTAVSNQPSGNIGTAYEFGSDVTTFNEPVTISITYDEAFLPSGVSESDIKLGMITNNQWQEITNSVVDTIANIVSGTTSHLSIYGVIAVSNSGTEPAAPSGVVASAGDGNVNISWNVVSKATSYNVYWSTTSGISKTSYTGKITGVTSPYPHMGLINDTTYYYVVTAVNSYGESSESSQVSATPTSTVFPDITAPLNTTASNFINSGAASTNSTNVTLTLSATDNAGVTGYCAKELSAAPLGNDTCWTSISSVTSYSAGITFTLSSVEGTKTVYVWFKDAAGNISSAANDSIILGSPPSAPTGVTATVSDGQATISWDAVSNATSYNIYWSTTSGVTKSTGTKISNITSPYTHTGRTNGTTYYYVVTVVNDFGESAESSQLSVIPQAPIRLPKTGQTTCYDNSGIIVACAGTGQDGDLQRGVAWPSPRFTDNGDGTVTDNLTGLVWTKDGNAPGPVACSPATLKTWQGALDYVACLNTNNYLGYTDWRLPNINELRSLVHAGQSYTSSWLNTVGLNSVSDYYWSSTSSAFDSFRAYFVDMYYGKVRAEDKSYNYGPYGFVWPVRSGYYELFGKSIISLPKTGQTTCYDRFGYVIACIGTGQDGDVQAGTAWPNPRFTDNEDGTVTDNLTDLIWTKDAKAPGPATCSPAIRKSWQGALDYVACLNTNNYLGYTDWRLPNINELRSLVHAGQSYTSSWLNTQGFNNVQLDYYWSSTSYALDSSYAWCVNMGNGYVSYSGKPYYYGNHYYIWPVRSGQ